MLEYFAANFDSWASKNLPRQVVELELDAILEKRQLKRSQASRRLTAYEKTRLELVAVSINADQSTIERNISNLLGGAEAVVDVLLDAFAESKF